MKRYIFSFLLASSVAYGATTTPVQLLNPTGSSSGQAVVSTGSSSAPAWGGIGVNGIAAIGANSVIANVSNSSASPTAASVPGCGGVSSALIYVGGTGFSCNSAINASTLGGASLGTSGNTVPLLNGVNTWSAAQTFSGIITPSSTAGIAGTTTNNNANAGSIGEFGTATTNTTSLTSGSPANCTSISVSAGDWDVEGVVTYTPSGSMTVTGMVSGVNTTSATFGAFGSYVQSNSSVTVSVPQTFATPVFRVSVAGTTTVYVVGQASFSGGTMTCNGFIRARRVR